MNHACLILNDNWKFEKKKSNTLACMPLLFLFYDINAEVNIKLLAESIPEFTSNKKMIPVGDVRLSLYYERPDFCYLDRNEHSDFVKDNKAVEIIKTLLLTGHHVIAVIQSDSEISAIERLNKLACKNVIETGEN